MSSEVKAPSAKELQAVWFRPIPFASYGPLPYFVTPVAAFGTFDALSTGEESHRRCVRMATWLRSQFPTPLEWVDNAMAEIAMFDVSLAKVSSATPAWTVVWTQRSKVVRAFEIRLEDAIRQYLAGLEAA